ncbi:MAG: twin-arginine translocase TatA/TatE family subunit [Byssovorax cruenta]
MEFLGIGPSELVFIVIIAIIILGPKDMQKAGKTVGRWLNHFIRSDGWKALQRASREIRNLPTTLMREANMEEIQSLGKDLRQSIDPRPRPPAPSANRSLPPSEPPQTTPPPAPDNADAPIGDEPEQP